MEAHLAPHIIQPTPRAPSPPTPTFEAAQGDLELSQRRLRRLCARGLQAEVAELLDRWPGSALDLGGPKYSAVYSAAQNGHAALLQYLTARGFPLLGPGNCSSVPNAAIKNAAETGSFEVLELLLEHGWQPSMQEDGESKAPLVYALHNEDVVRWLLDHGANPNTVTRQALNLTVMTRAASVAPLPIVKLLLSCGGEVAGTDAVAQAVIGHNSGVLGRLEVVEFLIDNGAPIDAFAYNHSLVAGIAGLLNGLHLAAEEGKKDMVELLLRRGADRNIKSTMFRPVLTLSTALELAEAKGFDSIAKLLRERNSPMVYK